MTTPVAPQLLSSADLSSFQASDPAWFINAAGETIRNFCQWHIAPSITVTDTVPIQPDGTIMLPSLHVTGLQFVAMHGVEIDPSTYHLHQEGFITRHLGQITEWDSVGMPLWPMESDQPFREYPSSTRHHATVTYTHGYPTLPEVVKDVGLELATRAMELPSGAATAITAGPQTISFGALGLVLSNEQKDRLGPFRLVRF